MLFNKSEINDNDEHIPGYFQWRIIVFFFELENREVKIWFGWTIF